jgi:hypothetical protein
MNRKERENRKKDYRWIERKCKIKERVERNKE